MRKLIFIFASLIILISCETAEDNSPQTISKNYYNAWYGFEWEQIATFLHPASLENFRTNIMIFGGLIDSNYNSTSYLDSLLLADPNSINNLLKFLSDSSTSSVSNKVFFISFCEIVYPKRIVELNPLFPDAIEYLGQIQEGSDTTHVLNRITITKNRAKINDISLLSLKKYQSSWKVLLPKELENRLKMQLEFNKSSIFRNF